MKYVIIGNISNEWIGKQEKRLTTVREKLKKLGIKLDSVLYTQGPYDFVSTVDADNPEAVLTFTLWYNAKGLGRTVTMAAYDVGQMGQAVRKAASL
jgi:uncharacterized protein with GYD domain